MIIYEQPQAFVMIRQHDHARLSGVVVEHWQVPETFAERWADVCYAVYQHDRSWIGLDHTPLWNDKLQSPYSFSDYPMIPKLRFYTLGIEETERENPYAALLCSMHYASFLAQSEHAEGKQFYEEEQERQQRLRALLGITTQAQQEVLQYHFHLLQFCDDVSLYVCLNQPGAAKAEEHPWYRQGFRNSELLTPSRQRIIASWQDEQRIALNPFPFHTACSASLPLKIVNKENIRQQGVADAYEAAPWQERNITMISVQE